MNHGSLFSGIGGFDLAAEWMDWTNVFHCEWEEFPRKILNYHFPKSISYGDIKKTDFTVHRGQIDILTGGFPCQPYSAAGKRLGKEDDRHLWPQMLRAIREIQPRWVVGENVHGIVNWDGGLVFEEVQANLEAEGYEVQPFILGAASVNAPHKRDRVWFVAYSGCKYNFNTCTNRTMCKNCEDGSNCEEWLNAYSNSQRQVGSRDEGINLGKRKKRKQRLGKFCDIKHQWEKCTTKPIICGLDDGISRELDSISFSKWRNESIKGYGNAIVPQVVYPIFKAIESYEDKN